MPWTPARRNATTQAVTLIYQQKMVGRPQPTGIRSKKAAIFFLNQIFSTGPWDFSHSSDECPALSISCSCCLTDDSGIDLPFCVSQCPVNSISDLSNSKQILLHILSIKSSETEQNVSLKCHMQMLYLVHFLNGWMCLLSSSFRADDKCHTDKPKVFHKFLISSCYWNLIIFQLAMNLCGTSIPCEVSSFTSSCWGKLCT